MDVVATLAIFINGEAADFAWRLFSVLSVNSKVLFRVCACAKDRRERDRELKKTVSSKERTVDRKERKTASLIPVR